MKEKRCANFEMKEEERKKEEREKGGGTKVEQRRLDEKPLDSVVHNRDTSYHRE